MWNYVFYIAYLNDKVFSNYLFILFLGRNRIYWHWILYRWKIG